MNSKKILIILLLILNIQYFVKKTGEHSVLKEIPVAVNVSENIFDTRVIKFILTHKDVITLISLQIKKETQIVFDAPSEFSDTITREFGSDIRRIDIENGEHVRFSVILK